jgi:hypothetical protein
MPSRFARTPRARHVGEADRDEKRRAVRAAVACGPVLGQSSCIGEMASHLPAWGDDEERTEEDRASVTVAPKWPAGRWLRIREAPQKACHGEGTAAKRGRKEEDGER